jgi:NADPH-dependent 2,4-dienoyl-CoA reductase/sulfur reductase-like enzyme
MKKYHYIIIGGGMTGSAAVMGIREVDQQGSIAMFSRDSHGPYNRPPLSKSLWGKGKVEDIMRPMDKYDVDLFLQDKITAIHPQEKWVESEKGQKLSYDKLLLATGGHPIHLKNMPDGVIYYRTLSDFEKLQKLVETKQDFCVVGAGFIGSEIAAALNKQGKSVTMIFPEIGIAGRIFPDGLSEYMNDYYQEKGVKVLSGNLVKAIDKKGEKYTVTYTNQDTGEAQHVEFDGVVVGVGIKPNIFLADEAGLSVENGVVVNDYLQTDAPDVYAAGDVANFYNHALEERTRVEHEDNANTMGMLAGKNMAGEKLAYEHFPFFYSDLFDMGYEALGDLHKDARIVEDWIEPYKKGAIVYLEDNKVRGAIFWNLWGKVDQGREVIAAGESFPGDAIKGVFTQD